MGNTLTHSPPTLSQTTNSKKIEHGPFVQVGIQLTKQKYKKKCKSQTHNNMLSVRCHLGGNRSNRQWTTIMDNRRGDLMDIAESRTFMRSWYISASIFKIKLNTIRILWSRKKCFLFMKMNNFRGGLIDIPSTKEALWYMYWIFPIC